MRHKSRMLFVACSNILRHEDDWGIASGTPRKVPMKMKVPIIKKVPYKV